MYDKLIAGAVKEAKKVEPRGKTKAIKKVKKNEPLPPPPIQPVRPEVKEPPSPNRVPIPNELPIPPPPPELGKLTDNESLFKEFLSHTKETSVKLTKDDVAILKDRFDSITKSYMGAVRICIPESCKHADLENHRGICPFIRINKFPRNHNCPLELCIANEAAAQYYKLLQEELGTTSFNIIEHQTVRELIDVDLEEFRARSQLTDLGMLIDYAALVVNESGEVIYNKTENPLYNVVERLSRRKQKLLQRLLLTPESKARFKIENHRGQKQSAADILKRIEHKLEQKILDSHK